MKLKNIKRKILRPFGFDIRIHRVHKKSMRTTKLSLYKTKTGSYYLPTDAHQDIIAIEIREDRIFDKDIYDISKKYIKSNSIVLDLGSNFGQLAILFSRLVGQNGKVHAFEADDFVYEILTKKY